MNHRIDHAITALTKTAVLGALTGGIVGLARDKDPWENRQEAFARSLGTGAATDAGIGAGSGIGALLGGLAGYGVDRMSNGALPDDPRKMDPKKLLARLAAMSIGAGAGGILGGTAGGIGAYQLAKRRPSRVKARIAAQRKHDPQSLTRDMEKEDVREQDKDVSGELQKNAYVYKVAAAYALKKTAEPKFLEGTVGDLAGWAQKNFGGKDSQPGAWANNAQEFWRNHGGKVMGGLAGGAAGLVGGQFTDEDSKLRWLLPLLGAGAGVAGGHYGYDSPDNAFGQAFRPSPSKDPRFTFGDQVKDSQNAPGYLAGRRQAPISPEQQGANLSRIMPMLGQGADRLKAQARAHLQALRRQRVENLF